MKQPLKAEFETKDLGHAKKILGIETARKRRTKELFLSQSSYVKRVPERFGMIEDKPILTLLAQYLN